MQKSSPALVLRPTMAQDLQRSGDPSCTLMHTCDFLQPFFLGGGGECEPQGTNPGLSAFVGLGGIF